MPHIRAITGRPCLTWSAPAVTRVKIRRLGSWHYPLTHNVCRLGSWSYNGLVVDLRVSEHPVDTSVLVANSEWKLLSFTMQNRTVSGNSNGSVWPLGIAGNRRFDLWIPWPYSETSIQRMSKGPKNFLCYRPIFVITSIENKKDNLKRLEYSICYWRISVIWVRYSEV